MPGLVQVVVNQLSSSNARYVGQRMDTIPEPYRYEAEEAILSVIIHYYCLSKTQQEGSPCATSATWGLPALPPGVPGGSRDIGMPMTMSISETPFVTHVTLAITAVPTLPSQMARTSVTTTAATYQ